MEFWKLKNLQSPSGRQKKRLSQFLIDLHTAGYVHGDLRSANVFSKEEDDDIAILDFDWAGKIGVKYPLTLNHNIIWPKDAPGRCITKEHDVYWIDKIIKNQQ